MRTIMFQVQPTQTKPNQANRIIHKNENEVNT